MAESVAKEMGRISKYIANEDGFEVAKCGESGEDVDAKYRGRRVRWVWSVGGLVGGVLRRRENDDLCWRFEEEMSEDRLKTVVGIAPKELGWKEDGWDVGVVLIMRPLKSFDGSRIC